MKTTKLNYSKCIIGIEETDLQEKYDNRTQIAVLRCNDKFYDAVTKEEIDAIEEFIYEEGKTWEEIGEKSLETIFTESVTLKAHNLTANLISPLGLYSNNKYSDEYAYCLEIIYFDGTADFWSRDTIEECYFAALNQDDCGYKGRFKEIEVSRTKSI